MPQPVIHKNGLVAASEIHNMKRKFALVALSLLSITAFADPITGGNAEAGKTKSAPCAACHGATGDSQNAQFPKLAGQSPAYVVKQLGKFKSGERANPVMAPQAAALSDQDMKDLAAFYATQKPGFGAANEKVAAAGQKLYLGGRPEDGLPACSGCHGPVGHGNAAAAYPLVGGQHADYTAAQLRAYKNGSRKAPAMSVVTQKLSDEDIQALASYLAGLH